MQRTRWIPNKKTKIFFWIWESELQLTHYLAVVTRSPNLFLSVMHRIRNPRVGFTKLWKCVGSSNYIRPVEVSLQPNTTSNQVFLARIRFYNHENLWKKSPWKILRFICHSTWRQQRQSRYLLTIFGAIFRNIRGWRIE